MSYMSWKSQSFLEKSTARPLNIAVCALALTLILLIVGSCFYKIDKTVVAYGEIVSEKGQNEIIAKQDGSVESIQAEVGDKVVEGQVLAKIQVQFSSLSELAHILEKYNKTYEIVSKNNLDQEISGELDGLKSENPFVMSLILDSRTQLKKYNLIALESQTGVAKKLQVFKYRKEKTNQKLKSLLQSEQKNFLTPLIDELKEQQHQIEIENITTQEDIKSKISLARNDLLGTLKNNYLQIYNFYDSHLVKATMSGIIARKNISNWQNVQKNQKLISIVPDQSHFSVKLALPSASIGQVSSKFLTKFEVDSFPYQKYGQFEGELTSVDQTVTAAPQDSSYQAYSSIRSPASSKERPVLLQLLPGMKVKAYIQTRKLTIMRLFYEKIFLNENE